MIQTYFYSGLFKCTCQHQTADVCDNIADVWLEIKATIEMYTYVFCFYH